MQLTYEVVEEYAEYVVIKITSCKSKGGSMTVNSIRIFFTGKPKFHISNDTVYLDLMKDSDEHYPLIIPRKYWSQVKEALDSLAPKSDFTKFCEANDLRIYKLEKSKNKQLVIDIGDGKYKTLMNLVGQAIVAGYLYEESEEVFNTTFTFNAGKVCYASHVLVKEIL